MAWNETASILGTGDTADAVARKADAIFTATFVGLVIDRGRQAQEFRTLPPKLGKVA